jgi:hypothetical protein
MEYDRYSTSDIVSKLYHYFPRNNMEPSFEGSIATGTATFFLPSLALRNITHEK